MHEHTSEGRDWETNVSGEMQNDVKKMHPITQKSTITLCPLALILKKFYMKFTNFDRENLEPVRFYEKYLLWMAIIMLYKTII